MSSFTSAGSGSWLIWSNPFADGIGALTPGLASTLS